MATSPSGLDPPAALMVEDGADGGGGEEESTRMKVLEDMVKKLKLEKEELMNQMSNSRGDDDDSSSSSLLNGNVRVTTPISLEDNDDILEMISDKETEDDMWLYVSPLRPPTKEHKKISPSQWLSEGKMRQRASYREQSFQDIKTSLAFAMSETEVVPKMSSSKLSKGGRASPSNKTAQKYLNEVRRRRNSLSESEDSSSERGGPSPSRSPVPTVRKSDTFTKKARNVPVRPVVPAQAPRGIGAAGSDRDNDSSSLKVKRWDPSKAAVTSDGEEEEEEEPRRWKVKQVRGTPPPTNKWKVKQVPDSEVGGDEASESSPQEERKWKVKQVVDPSPNEEEREQDEVIPNLQRKWKVKQVIDPGPNEDEREQDEVIPNLQRKWKVKQVVDHNEDEGKEEEEEEVPQRKWAVKQVPDASEESRPINVTRESTPTQEPPRRKGTYTLEDEEGEEEREMQHRKIERKGTYTAIGGTEKEEGDRGEKKREEEGEEEREVQHRKIKRKGTYTAIGGTEKEEGDRGEEKGEEEGEEEEDEKKGGATVKRSGTFTKDKPKVYSRRPDNDGGRDSSASDRTMSPIDPGENLKIKWTPTNRNPSPSSGDEGKRTRTQSPTSPRGSPEQTRQSRYSTHQAQLRQMPQMPHPSIGGRGQFRSPVSRQGLPSPLRQQRQADGGGGGTSPYTSPVKPVTPRLRPPSPRRSQPSANEENTPTSTPRVATAQTTPTGHTPRGSSAQTTPTGHTPRMNAQTTPTSHTPRMSAQTTPTGQSGISPRGRGAKGLSPGIKIARPLNPSQGGGASLSGQQPQRRRILPVAQSTKGMSPRAGGKVVKSPRGTESGGGRGKKQSPQEKQDDSWLDECF
ncbi:PREDICTED: serine/arginine repetitive matrix protein 1-like [Amphimedon queenslandica]|uniref:Uncharacterized protein n=1 Tax=Amphimedon queenslandica TaxID=400682 RepID=A0A1X7V4L8_AMPQE|nr:PREDICTED: serine/arginine repetitive matrix protein 1-like [Amphimedon queenslandica]|eukprot:XP_019850849.1 PREDICTED: serine/arginine repetitive matrix protein 1-like [Amphimedon queenslandica]